MRACTAAAAALMLLTLASAAQQAPKQPAAAADPCKDLQDASDNSFLSWSNWTDGRSRAEARRDELANRFRDAKQETERLNCWPRRADNTAACKAALARHDAVQTELQAAQSNLEGVKQGADAARQRHIRADDAYRKCASAAAASAPASPSSGQPPTTTQPTAPAQSATAPAQPQQPAAAATDKCKSLEAAADKAQRSYSEWSEVLMLQGQEREARETEFHEANQETERLGCWPRRADSNPECADALAYHDEVLARIRALDANLIGLRSGTDASRERRDAAKEALARCVAGLPGPPGPKPEDLPLFPPVAPTEQPATKPPAPQQPPTPPVTEQPKPPTPPAPPPATEAFVPRVLPPGTYQAQLWPGGQQFRDRCREDLDNRVYPYPVILTVDASGKVTGTSRWALTPAERTENPGKGHCGQRGVNEVSFRLDGKIDWTTGAITLRLLNGRQEVGYSDNQGPSLTHVEFEFSLSGWQLLHPALRKPAAAILAGKERPNLEAQGLPQFALDATGQVTFRDFGFAGIPPSGGSRFTVQKFIGGDKVDRTDVIKANWEGGVDYWYLKILGPMTVTPAAKPPKGPQTDPNGFAVWPLSPLRVKPGETFALNAMGAYADNPYDAVNLNDRSTWQMSPGVTRPAGNQFRATAPGRYQVTATFRRNDGSTMSGTVDIIVGP